MIGKVLELNQYTLKHIPGGGDELIDQLVVLGPRRRRRRRPV
jgi:hypothetical protein